MFAVADEEGIKKPDGIAVMVQDKAIRSNITLINVSGHLVISTCDRSEKTPENDIYSSLPDKCQQKRT